MVSTYPLPIAPLPASTARPGVSIVCMAQIVSHLSWQKVFERYGGPTYIHLSEIQVMNGTEKWLLCFLASYRKPTTGLGCHMQSVAYCSVTLKGLNGLEDRAEHDAGKRHPTSGSICIEESPTLISPVVPPGGWLAKLDLLRPLCI